jgi:hypothetical protein
MVIIDRTRWYIRLSPSLLWDVPDVAGVGSGASNSKANQSPTSIRIVPGMREAARSDKKMELVDVLIGVGKITRWKITG